MCLSINRNHYLNICKWEHSYLLNKICTQEKVLGEVVNHRKSCVRCSV